MSNIKIDGKKLDRLIRVPDRDSLIQDERGLWRGMVYYRCEWRRVFTLMPRRGVTKHPDFANLVAERVTVSREKPNIAVIACEYVGAGDGPSDPTASYGANSAIIEVSATVSQEPIETHPRFTEMTLSPSLGEWPGVLITEDGGTVFGKFPKEDSEGNDCPYHGVTDYLAPQKTCRRTTIRKTAPSASDVNSAGKLSDPPIAGQTDWLKTEFSYVREGAVYVVTESWLSPAEGKEFGGDNVIYES